MSYKWKSTEREIIEYARKEYPSFVFWKGRLSDEEMKTIEKKCEVHRVAVFADGSATFSIRYRKDKIFISVV